MRFLSTVVVFCWFSLLSLSAQNSLKISGKSITELRQPIIFAYTFPQPVFYHKIAHINNSTAPLLYAYTFDWSANYINHLGFFCKVELKIENKTQLPVKFRLGTVQYVDQLEQKY